MRMERKGGAPVWPSPPHCILAPSLKSTQLMWICGKYSDVYSDDKSNLRCNLSHARSVWL